MKTTLFALLLTALFSAILYAQPKTYILVHGGWHGAWCWKKVVPLLEAKGNRVLAIDLPGHGEDKTPAATVTLKDYVQKVVRVANAQTGPVILVGHSMPGVVIAQAGEVLGTGKIAKLVFLDAFMPIQFGYTDYNHLAKDFRQFANVTPNIMIREYAQRPEIIVML